MGQAAHDERLHADRGGDARPGVLLRRGQGRSNPRAHGRPARSSGRGATAAAGLPHGGTCGGSDRVRASAPRRRGVMPAPEAETRPWAEQVALDDASYRTQVGYLFERSAFYREKLTGAGFRTARAVGGLASIAQLPLTDKYELRATCTPENPIGTHLCVGRSDIARIYSTSGTTGTPSYIPLTTEDLENWVTG